MKSRANKIRFLSVKEFPRSKSLAKLLQRNQRMLANLIPLTQRPYLRYTTSQNSTEKLAKIVSGVPGKADSLKPGTDSI